MLSLFYLHIVRNDDDKDDQAINKSSAVPEKSLKTQLI